MDFGVKLMKTIHRLLLFMAILIASLAFSMSAYALEPNLGVSDSYRDSEYYSQLTAVDTSSENQRQIFYAVAQSQLGYHESDSANDLSGLSSGAKNFTEYGRAMRANGTSLCAYFISWCARQAGVDSIKNSGYAGPFSDTRYSWAEIVNGAYLPQAGDIVTFKWSTDNFTYSHVGIVSSCTRNRNGSYQLVTIEGNSDNSVQQKTRNINANGTITGTTHRIVNFGVPDFQNSGVPAPPPTVGRTSQPTVSVNGQDVTVSWNYSGSAESLDIYLVQVPWRWEDIKYSASVTPKGKNYTFGNVAAGEYQTFIIARPNPDNIQSEWTAITVAVEPAEITELPKQEKLSDNSDTNIPKIIVNNGNRYLYVYQPTGEVIRQLGAGNYEVHMYPGTTYQLDTVITPDDGTQKLDYSVKSINNDPNNGDGITVDENGLITASEMAVGSVRILITCGSAKEEITIIMELLTKS